MKLLKEINKARKKALVLGLADKKYSITDNEGITVSGEKSYRTYLTVINGDAVYSY